MKKRNSKLYLKDILDSIEKIEDYTKDLTFQEFPANKMAVDAVIRNFEIIGEAGKNIPDDLKNSHSEIPWKEMTGMRDKMIHQYFGIDLDIIWKTLKDRLPQIKILIKNIYHIEEDTV